MTNRSAETIFVSMPAQDDEETKHSIRSAFENAEFPERIYLGVALTSLKLKHKKEIESLMSKNKNIKMDYQKQKKNDLSTLGIGQGRTRSAALYDDQDYMLQVDCHTLFEKNWDSKMIDMFHKASEEVGDDNMVISCIPLLYSYSKDGTLVRDKNPESRYATYVMDSFFVDVVPRWREVDIMSFKDEGFYPAHKLNPACTFGNKNFAKDPGIHKDAIFYDEDWTQQLNLFNRGIAFVFPNFKDFPIRHLDGKVDEIKDHRRLFFTEYLSKQKNVEIHENLMSNYLKFVKDPNNKEAIEKYAKYSKAHAVRGYFSASEDPMPKRYRGAN